MFEIIIFPIIWILYAYFDGNLEGYCYHFASKYEVDSNPNPRRNFIGIVSRILMAQRVLLLITIAIGFNEPFRATVMIFILICTFAYFHNGAYYCKRNDLDSNIYPKRWKEDLETNSPLFDVAYPDRVIALIIGIVLYISMITYISYFFS